MGKHVDRAVGGKVVETGKTPKFENTKAYKELVNQIGILEGVAETLAGKVEELNGKVEAIVGALPTTKTEPTE